MVKGIEMTGIERANMATPRSHERDAKALAHPNNASSSEKI
jgi:hypothetical protein